MNTPRIAKVMNYIDDDLVSWTVEYKRTKKLNNLKKWCTVAACLCLIIFAFPVIIQNSSQTEATDTIQLYEVSESTQERLELKLIDEYRGNIHYSWGEPDGTLSNSYADKYYLDETTGEYIILYYDNNDYVIDFELGTEN